MAKQVIRSLLTALREIEKIEAKVNNARLRNSNRQEHKATKYISDARKRLEKEKKFLFDNQRRLPEDVWSDSFSFYKSLEESCNQAFVENELSHKNYQAPVADTTTHVKRKKSWIGRMSLASLVFLSGISAGYALDDQIEHYLFPHHEDIIEFKIKDSWMKPLPYFSTTDSDNPKEASPVEQQPLDDARTYPSQLLELNEEVEEGKYVLIIDKNNQTLDIYQKTEWERIGEMLCSTGLNSGDKEMTGDKRTPEGISRVISIENSSNWFFREKRAYGDNFIRLDFEDNNYTGIGIHGTNEPEKLGSRASRGCIRVSDENLCKLVDDYMSIGSFCIVLPGEVYGPVLENQ